jgi:uracil-DNA glycosylase
MPPPVVADPVAGARLLLVGQAPGPRERGSGRLFAYTAGRRLFAWFAELGVDEQEFRRRVWMAAVIRCFPGRAPQGGDRAPVPAEVDACRPWLERELDLVRPLTVIAVGGLAARVFLPPAPLVERVGRLFRVERAGRRLEVVPLPHPSGRSTWINRPEHGALLARALERLRRSAGWRATFERRPRSRR